MKAIVATDRDWGIGKQNDLLVSLPPDMKFFREQTRNSLIVMGRKTLLSFPHQKPLPNRVNVVLTRDKDFTCPEVSVVHSLDELKHLLEATSHLPHFLVGGASVYAQLIDYCDEALVTRMDKSYDAQVFFPNLDARPGWECKDPGIVQHYNEIGFRFARYINRTPQVW